MWLKLWKILILSAGALIVLSTVHKKFKTSSPKLVNKFKDVVSVCRKVRSPAEFGEVVSVLRDFMM